jgi:anti-sigma factor RsiW
MTHNANSTAHLQPEQINAFVDRELPTGESQGIEQHLEICHRCALRVLSATQLKAATARAGGRFAPPPESLARLTAQLRPKLAMRPVVMSPSRGPQFRTSAGWLSLAAAILLAIALLGYRQVHQANTLTAELLDQHLATLSSAAPPQVISTDRHTVKPWFQGRLPFSFNLPESAALPPDTLLKGADLAYVEGQPAALLIFMIHKHQASVFVTQRRSSFAVGAHSVQSGFAVRSITTPELRITAVSDVNPGELDALATVIAKAQ